MACNVYCPILPDVLAFLRFRIVCEIAESSIKDAPRGHISVSTPGIAALLVPGSLVRLRPWLVFAVLLRRR
jgi:hypothetical protein